MSTNPEISDGRASSTSTFLTIPFEEIKRFLNYYQLPIPRDEEEAYEAVWDYILDHSGLDVPSTYLEDFILAYNHQDKVDQVYATSNLLLQSDTELLELTHSLGLRVVDKERLIRILGYLSLLDNDLSLFDKLPAEILRFMGMKLDCHSLGLFCRISSRFNQLFCETDQLTEMLRDKLQEINRLDLSQFTRDQLGILCLSSRNKSRMATGYHTLAVNSQGQVFGFGSNMNKEANPSRLNAIVSSPKPIRDPNIGSVVAVSTVSGSSLLLNSRGQVFSFGNNDYGQLGLGDKESKYTPTLIKDFDGENEIVIVSIAAGDHCLLLDTQGRVFSFGDNIVGQLGLGHTRRNILKPTLIEGMEQTIIAIAVGVVHSLLLDSDGQVFSLGRRLLMN
jgi:alpha-tubulin suppressor-like RCC1 family protein